MFYDKEFIDSIYNELKDEDKQLSKNCWISPYGHILTCDFYGHEQVLSDCGLELLHVENDGWIRVTYGPLFKNLNCQCLKRITQIQKRMIKKLLSNPENQNILKVGYSYIQVGGWYFYIDNNGKVIMDKDNYYEG